MRRSKVVLTFGVVALVVAAPIIGWVVSWTTTERTCVAEDDLASHTNRSTTYYEVRTSCGLLRVHSDLQHQVGDVVEDGQTYRMTIQDRHIVQYLVEPPEVVDGEDPQASDS